MTSQRPKQSRLDLSSVHKIPDSVISKRILDKKNFYLLDSDYEPINRPIRDWIAESKSLILSDVKRKSQEDKVKDLTFIDGIEYAYNTLLSELAFESSELEEKCLDILIPLISNWCIKCKKEISEK